MRRFRLNASVVWRRQGPKIFRRDARRQANVGRRKRERNRTSRLRRRNVDAWRNATSERFLELRTAENRALQNRRRETPKFFGRFEKRRKRRRGSDASLRSQRRVGTSACDERKQRGNGGGSDAALRPQRRVRTSTCNERKRRADDGGSDASLRPQRRVRTSACDERKRRPTSEETHASLRKGGGASLTVVSVRRFGSSVRFVGSINVPIKSSRSELKLIALDLNTKRSKTRTRFRLASLTLGRVAING